MMRIAITGATGVIGTALTKRLRAIGHATTTISRSPRGRGSIVWDPSEGRLDSTALVPHDAVVHLAAESIALRPATESVRRRFKDSRVLSTDLICRSMAAAATAGGPRTLICMSGTHFYGDRGDEVLTEGSAPGGGFLAEVCRDWEAAADPARDAGIRVVHLRTGPVQHPKAQSLRILLRLYKLGLGGPMGSGTQYISWISLDDLVGIIVSSLTTEQLDGPLNATAPHPVRQAHYAKTLAAALRRPAVIPVPRFGPRLVFGGMIDELLFYSQRVLPERVVESGYTFRHPTLAEALLVLPGHTGTSQEPQ